MLPSPLWRIDLEPAAFHMSLRAAYGSGRGSPVRDE